MPPLPINNRHHQLLNGIVMIKTFSRLQSKITGFQLAATTLGALLFNLWASHILNAAYAASGFPVAYWQAQLSFDHEKLKGWYGLLLSKQSLDLYIHAQLVDFIFIASVLILHIAALLALSRALPAESKARQALVWAALLSAIAPLADAIENFISFIMLANPTDFMPLLIRGCHQVRYVHVSLCCGSARPAVGGVLPRNTRLDKRAFGVIASASCGPIQTRVKPGSACKALVFDCQTHTACIPFVRICAVSF
jgi:hypothetical protein